jgi:arylsulfatase A-like enzyme
MRIILGTITSLILLTTTLTHAAGRPNLVLIFADDLGYGDLACFGSKTNQTPNLDRMAAEGVKLTQFYTPMPFCAPSRAALLTGRYPFRNGMVNNPFPDGPPAGDKIGLASSEITLAETLKSAGYATSIIGKWHLGHQPQFLPTRQGFDEYFGIPYSNDMRPVHLLEGERVIEYPVIQATLTKRYTQRAVQFIERNKDKPFFLYLPHVMPHKPLAVSEEFYTNKDNHKTPRDPVQLYADVIRELDWSVGQVLQKLKDLDLDGKTLVIFTSDNGPWFGGSTGGLRGMKGKTFDGGYHVPFIARLPQQIPASHVSHELASVMDLYPTFCKLAGVELPKGTVFDGRDIWPLLTKKDAKSPHESLVVHQGASLAAIRAGQWKLHVRNPGPQDRMGAPDNADHSKWIDPRGPDGVTIVAQWEQAKPDLFPGVLTGDKAKPMMLFDLAADPGEQHDVAEKNPEMVQRLKAMFDEYEKQAAAAAKARKKK